MQKMAIKWRLLVLSIYSISSFISLHCRYLKTARQIYGTGSKQVRQFVKYKLKFTQHTNLVTKVISNVINWFGASIFLDTSVQTNLT